uniref:Uncharacterized protein n=1 Tax=Trichuris muris TaxID=70415 RepID=A0A5S6QX39_TRIMR
MDATFWRPLNHQRFALNQIRLFARLTEIMNSGCASFLPPFELWVVLFVAVGFLAMAAMQIELVANKRVAFEGIPRRPLDKVELINGDCTHLCNWVRPSGRNRTEQRRSSKGRRGARFTV